MSTLDDCGFSLIINKLSATAIIAARLHRTVFKVSARVEKSVHHLYRGDNEFSILGGGNYTFKTGSP